NSTLDRRMMSGFTSFIYHLIFDSISGFPHEISGIETTVNSRISVPVDCTYQQTRLMFNHDR
ncbi:MAG: hypothetical protein L7U52_01250, partial [Alphaproteobacteria bacterium]|nr:hypothetical protein [Alphaproteobacteria bacterium]